MQWVCSFETVKDRSLRLLDLISILLNDTMAFCLEVSCSSNINFSLDNIYFDTPLILLGPRTGDGEVVPFTCILNFINSCAVVL